MASKTDAANRPTRHLTDVKRNARWLEQLPRASMGETSRQLFGALNDMAQLRLAGRTRLQVLEQMYPVLTQVLEYLRRYYSAARYPLSTKSQRVIELNETMLLRMAENYALAAQDLGGVRALAAGKQLGLATVRGLLATGDYLLRTVQIYSTYRDGTWQRLHDLFQMAEKARIASTEFELMHEGERERISPEAAYTRVLLLFTLGPYGLSQGEAERLYSLLRVWGARAPLSAKPSAGTIPEFVVNLNADKPPLSFDVFRHKPADPDLRFLNVEALCHYLDSDRAVEESVDYVAREGGTRQENAVVLARKLTDRALKRWNLSASRRTERSAADQNVLLVQGLAQIYALLKPLKTREARGAPPVVDTGPMPNVAEHDKDSDSELNASFFRAFSNERHERMLRREAGASRNPEPSAHRASPEPGDESEAAVQQRWTMTNVSAGGCALRWHDAGSVSVRVGELVAINEQPERPQTSTGWRLGIVRWIQTEKPNRLEVGVEFMGRHGAPLSIHRPGEAIDREALLVISGEGDEPTEVAVPTYLFQPGSRVGAQGPNGPISLDLTRVVEQTDFFTLYEFDRVQSRTQPEGYGAEGVAGATSHGPDPEDDSFWSSL